MLLFPLQLRPVRLLSGLQCVHTMQPFNVPAANLARWCDVVRSSESKRFAWPAILACYSKAGVYY